MGCSRFALRTCRRCGFAGCRFPRHTTLWRFWSRHTAAIGRLFKYSVQVAAQAGLVDMALVAIDGTTIASCSSRRTGWNKQQLTKRLEHADAYLRGLEEEISRTSEAESAHGELKRSVKNMKQRRQKMVEAIAHLARQGVGAMHPHEPDAAVMNCDGRRQWAWNCQAAVDDNCGVVVATEVTNEANDGHCLKRMMDATAANLEGQEPQLFVADSAYGRCEDEVHRADQAGYAFVTARVKEESAPYHRSKFVFDREAMQLTCPAGYALTHTGGSHRANGRVERFRCLDWKQCGAGAACHGKSRNGRKVEISPLHEVMNAHRAQVTRHDRKMLMRRRLKTVEPVFARRKQQDRFRRFLVRGRQKVSAQWEALNLMHNLKLLLKAAITPKRWAKAGKTARSGPNGSCAGGFVERLFAIGVRECFATVWRMGHLMGHCELRRLA